MNRLKKFWNFLKEDTWQSWFVSLILLVILIKFIFFPLLSLTTGASLPLVVVESCSMYHSSSDFESWWDQNSPWYENNDLSSANFKKFPHTNGLNKGDIILIWGYSEYKIGDIIVFNPNQESTAPNPLIHRIVHETPWETKGDNNFQQLELNNNPQNIDETNIQKEQIIGKAVVRIPFLGWIKLVFFEPARQPQQRGFCN